MTTTSQKPKTLLEAVRASLVRAARYGPGETFRVLKKNEIRLFGEYRTRRLVLEAWDKMFA